MSDPESARQRRPVLPRWRLSAAWGAVVLLAILGLETWAHLGADPDFWFPDPFRWLAGWLVALFLVTGFLPWAALRFNLRLVLGLIPVIAFIGMDAWYRLRPVDRGSLRVVVTPEDPLLRYHYRPGAQTFEKGRDGRELLITGDGLWDVEHPVAKPAGTYRIVLLGDSVPNDPSIPFFERFPRLLGEKLTAETNRTVEVINVSCEGWNSIQEVRFLERVGLKYQPDLVLVAYVLNDPFLQNGGYRRVGNSFALFQWSVIALRALGKNTCTLFGRLHEGYTFDLVVRASFEKLRLLADAHHFRAAVALLPLVEPFDDPTCGAAYDLAAAAARDSDLPVLRIVDALKGEDHHLYLKPRDKMDVTHPNAAGHRRMADSMAKFVRPWVDAAILPGPTGTAAP